MAVQYTKNTQLSPFVSVARQMTETPVENVDTKWEMAFDDLTISEN